MKIEYSALLDLIPREEDRQEFTQLSRQYYDTAQTAETADPSARADAQSRQSELLDKIIERIQWHFRAMRRSLPTRDEVAEMVDEHFK